VTALTDVTCWFLSREAQDFRAGGESQVASCLLQGTVMFSWCKSHRLVVGLLVLVAAVAAAGSFLFYRPPDIRAFWAVQGDWDAAGERESGHAERCLDVARKHPGTVGGLSALLLAATRAPDTAAGKEANQQLARQIETAEIGNLAAAFDRGVRGRWQAMQNLAPAFLARARRSPDHPNVARLLAAVCSMTRPNEDGSPPAIYQEAADLIAGEHASSPDIGHF
jgi:hypothetical protein